MNKIVLLCMLIVMLSITGCPNARRDPTYDPTQPTPNGIPPYHGNRF